MGGETSLSSLLLVVLKSIGFVSGVCDARLTLPKPPLSILVCGEEGGREYITTIDNYVDEIVAIYI